MTAEIVNLAFRRGAEQPDENCVLVHEGQRFGLFTAEFRLGEETHAIEFWAADFAAAEQIVAQVRGSITLTGQITSIVDDDTSLEQRLAACLADCIDQPLMSGRDECGGFRSPQEIRLGFFRPDLADRAAELLEEAGR